MDSALVRWTEDDSIMLKRVWNVVTGGRSCKGAAARALVSDELSEEMNRCDPCEFVLTGKKKTLIIIWVID